MWSNIGKKDIERNIKEFITDWLDKLTDIKVGIAQEAIDGLSVEQEEATTAAVLKLVR